MLHNIISKFDHDTQLKIGMGDWGVWQPSLDLMNLAAEDWRSQLGGLKEGWLVWNVIDDWCVAQQRLVQAAGWTPIVGYDPRAGRPSLVKGSVLVDFNRPFGLPNMLPHFPLEFAFLFLDKVAFFHSDLFIRKSKLAILSDAFRKMPDDCCMAVRHGGLRQALMRRVMKNKCRYWELVGCTTRDASKSQYDNGCGWWKGFWAHPNFRGPARSYCWDHGGGIFYWGRLAGANVISISEQYVQEGHFSQIGNQSYRRVSQNDHRRNLSLDLAENHSLKECLKQLDLEELLTGT